MSEAARVVRIGTRGSALALAQARLAAAALAAQGRAHEVVMIETEGDRRTPDTAWGEGAFVKSIEQALLDGRVDVAVHSAKDVPTEEDPRLRTCAYLERAEPLDALVVAGDGGLRPTVDSLPAGSVVGTDSPRRTGFLRWLRPDLDVRPLHGNVDTRLRRLDAGEVDALVLAVAGLLRLGREKRISQRLAAEDVPPAPGQGAIALQVRANDEDLLTLGAAMDHRATRQAVEAERAFLRASGGGCRAPIGALGRVTDGRLRLLGGYSTADGRLALLEEIEGSADEGEGLGRELAARLGAKRERLLGGPRVVLTRPSEQSRRLATQLAEHGLRGVVVPAIEIMHLGPGSGIDEAIGDLADYDWVVVTSANGARAMVGAAGGLLAGSGGVRWAAVGEATARALRLAGIGEIWLPGSASGAALGRELPVCTGTRVRLARGDLADSSLPDELRKRGADVRELVVYRTVEAPAGSRQLLSDALDAGTPRAVVFASPSAVRGLLSLAAAEHEADVLALPAICIGPTTTAAARDAGFTILGRATSQDTLELARLTADLLARHSTSVSA
ncbi:hypothetical protein BH24CHL6_BH24CHL6_08300 [soil metagenome]